MNGSLRIGLAGLGTVGIEVAGRLLHEAVPGVTLTAVCARDRARDRGLDLSAVRAVIFDEADRLFEEGFLDQVDVILDACGKTSSVDVGGGS
ncbi:MAG: hypothetical protein VX103_02610, partial [Pseudomonadota bacterium]|nr:hypothetical protein [Pseudomonadota bacterium]